MTLPNIVAAKRRTLYRAAFTDGETNNLRVARQNRPVKHPEGRKPKKQTVHYIIAMYAFSIFELNKNPAVDASAFPKHFICSQLLQEEQNQVNEAVKLFHTIKESYKAAKHGKVVFNAVSEYRSDLTSAAADNSVAALSKIYGNEQMLFIYNSSTCEAKERFIKLEKTEGVTTHGFAALYGYEACSRVAAMRATTKLKDITFLKLYFKPQQLVILRYP